jgi:hypothetical protein
MTESPSSLDISTKLERIAKQAREIRGAGLQTLAHYIDVDWLREAYRRTRKDGARGVDGQSAEQYAEQLEDNLASLLDRAKSGRLVAIFEHKDEAQRFLQDLPVRFGAFGLTLHPDKTRLVPFLRPDRVDNDDDRPGSFDFLGFTHYWTLSRRGKWYVMQKTAKDRFGRSLRRVREWCRLHRHDPLEAQQRALAKKLNGHYAYFGLTANFDAIARFVYEVRRTGARRSRVDLNRIFRGRRCYDCWSVTRCRLRASSTDTAHSESVSRRAGCGKSARPDLWGLVEATR